MPVDSSDKQSPRWGKDKLAVLLRREGFQVSSSTVGRTLSRLKKRGVLVEPLNVRLARGPPASGAGSPAIRSASLKAGGWTRRVTLVQLDSLQVKLNSGTIRWHFSARDVICRWDRARAYIRPTSFAASLFLEYLERKFPFAIRAIQIDGGSEFKKHFEEACQRHRVRLFVILARSPKLQAHVERANRTHREEFYEVEDIGLTLEENNKQLERWTDTYNTIRPHQSLDYQTPQEYYQAWLKEHKPKVSLM